MGLPPVIDVDKSKCQHCLACLKACPVKLCNIVEPDGIHVNPDLCLGCGECLRACNENGHQARRPVDDFSEFMAALTAGEQLGVLVAPAAAVNYAPWLGQMLTALRRMGVKYIFDVSFGAEITAYQYVKALNSEVTRPVIAQQCPAIVSFIEIYQPDLLPYLARSHSPAINTAIWLRSQPQSAGLKLAVLGSCLAARREVHDPDTEGVVSYSITFAALDEYLDRQDFNWRELEPGAFDSPEAERAVVFSQPGGLTETMKRFEISARNPDIARIEGAHQVYTRYLPELAIDLKAGLSPVLVDILNCQHGCNRGPAATHRHSLLQVNRIMENRRQEQQYKHGSSAPAEAKLLFRDFYAQLDAMNLDFGRTYTDLSAGAQLRQPDPEEEEMMWSLMHKEDEAEQRINCGSCGYGTCRDMMLAIYNGLNNLASCKNYLLRENEDVLRAVEAQAMEIEKAKDEMAAWNQVLEKTVAERTQSLRNLLDNAGQGFLTFGADLLINEDYSAECRHIFGRDIQGTDFAGLLYPDDPEQRQFLQALAPKILLEPSGGMRDLYLPLLPAEVNLNAKHIAVEYKIIRHVTSGQEIFMTILTDITGQRALESQVEQERNLLKMVVKVVVNYTDFVLNVKDYQRFCAERLPEILGFVSTVQAKVGEIFRHVHTFKGNFSQLGMNNLVDALHQMETHIANFQKTITPDTGQAELVAFFNQFDLISWLEEDLAGLEEILGKEFLTQEDELVVNKNKLLEIEKKAEALLSPAECKLLIPELRRLRYKLFDSLLKSFPDYVMKLAERYEKSIYPIEIQAEPIYVNPDQYHGFVKSLVHVFRNAVDHGLESADERIDSGKDENGRIECTVAAEDKIIELTIRDDGQGMDPEMIRGKAVEKGLLPSERAAALNRQEVLQLIFWDGFSTRDSVTDVSGRGIGLAAVKSELDKLGGSLAVTSQPGAGTEFQFKIPIIEEEVWGITVFELMTPLIETAKKYIEEQSGFAASDGGQFDIFKAKKLQLHTNTAFITMRGVLECSFILSLDENLLKTIVHNMVLDELSPEEENEYMSDVLTESTNVILGNSLQLFPGLEELLVIDPPIVLASEDAALRYSDSRIWYTNMNTDMGGFTLNLVVPREDYLVID